MGVIARGVRHSVGFAWHPQTRELWFTDHGRDWMGDDGPADELNRVTGIGQNFGFLYCHADGIPDRDFPKADACAGVTLPVQTMGPHSAVMGAHFYTGTMFPAEYRNTLLVARKGSWNRTQKFGYDVVTVRTDTQGNNPSIKAFMTGFLVCGTCHLPGYVGQSHVPRLAGQQEAYLLATLRMCRDNPAPGRDTLMSAPLQGMKDTELENLAHHLAHQGK